MKALIDFIVERLGARTILDILGRASEARKYVCRNCGTSIKYRQDLCPKCKVPFRWD